MLDAIKLSKLRIGKLGLQPGVLYELRHERTVPISGVWVIPDTPGTELIPAHSTPAESFNHLYFLYERFMVRLVATQSISRLMNAFSFYHEPDGITSEQYVAMLEASADMQAVYYNAPFQVDDSRETLDWMDNDKTT